MDTGHGTSCSGPGAQELDAALDRVMQETGAAVGLAYLLSPGERVLELAVVSGAPVRLTAPWARIPLDAHDLTAQAVRERRLVWVGGQEEVALSYPRTGLLLPYDVMMAAAPMTHGTTVWGALMLLWPARDPPGLSRRERDAMDSCGRRAGLLLQQTADRGHPLLPGERPRMLCPSLSHVPGRAEALAAADFTERLPLGCWALDLDGRITFTNTAAAALTGTAADDLLGARPWEVLPWLHDPLLGEHYRAAVIRCRPDSFTVLCPPDRWLSFRLYPHTRGIGVQITPVTDRQPSAEPARVMGVYPLMQLATTLTESLGVHDVAERVADLLMPSVGAQALALMTVREGRLHIIGHRGRTAELVNRCDALPLASRCPPAQVLAAGVPGFFATFAELGRSYPLAAPLKSSACRPARCSASIRPPTTRPPRSRCRLKPYSRSTPTDWWRSRAPTSVRPSPTSPTSSPPPGTRPWTLSPTPSSTTPRTPHDATTTSPCS